MTQAQLAEAVGTAQSVIARLEGGRDQRVPRFDLLDRIAAAVGRRCKIVFSRTKESSPLVEITPDSSPGSFTSQGSARRVACPGPNTVSGATERPEGSTSVDSPDRGPGRS